MRASSVRLPSPVRVNQKTPGPSSRSGWGEAEPEAGLAQHREEPQRGRAGSGNGEGDRGDGAEQQERAGRLGHHQRDQAGGEQQEDPRPQPGRPLEEAVQAGVMPTRLPEDRKSTRLNSSHVEISYA